MWIFLLVLAAAMGAWGLWRWSKQRRRAALFEQGLSETERAIVVDEVPLVRRLPTDLRAGFEGRIALFRHQVDFVGCNGLEVTREMELSIAAQACLIVVNSDIWYDHLSTILIYPGAFKSRQAEQNGYIVTERETVRVGESWERGPVVLSWPHVEQGAEDDTDGQNVVLHEFAHQLDALSGDTDGIPLLSRDQSPEDWIRIFGDAHDAHTRSVERGHKGVIDPYGALGPEEFFAVAVEAFFERPKQLHHEAADVYAQLSALLRVDPARWTS